MNCRMSGSTWRGVSGTEGRRSRGRYQQAIGRDAELEGCGGGPVVLMDVGADRADRWASAPISGEEAIASARVRAGSGRRRADASCRRPEMPRSRRPVWEWSTGPKQKGAPARPSGSHYAGNFPCRFNLSLGIQRREVLFSWGTGARRIGRRAPVLPLPF